MKRIRKVVSRIRNDGLKASKLSFRRVTTRRPGSVRRQQITASSAEARRSTSPMVWLRLSTPPPMLLDLLCLSALQAAHRSEVEVICARLLRMTFVCFPQKCCPRLNLLGRLIGFDCPLGASAFQAMQYLPHQQPGYPVHSHFTSQPGKLTSFLSF